MTVSNADLNKIFYARNKHGMIKIIVNSKNMATILEGIIYARY